MRTQVICIAIAIFWLPFYSSAQWVQTNGPYGGFIPCLAVSGTNLFAGTQGAGVFLSTNNSTPFTAFHDEDRLS